MRQIGPRGGVVVNDHCQTSAPDVYAIGEVALHRGRIYGLVSPGYQMARSRGLGKGGGIAVPKVVGTYLGRETNPPSSLYSPKTLHKLSFSSSAPPGILAADLPSWRPFL